MSEVTSPDSIPGEVYIDENNSKTANQASNNFEVSDTVDVPGTDTVNGPSPVTVDVDKTSNSATGVSSLFKNAVSGVKEAARGLGTRVTKAARGLGTRVTKAATGLGTRITTLKNSFADRFTHRPVVLQKSLKDLNTEVNGLKAQLQDEDPLFFGYSDDEFFNRGVQVPDWSLAYPKNDKKINTLDRMNDVRAFYMFLTSKHANIVELFNKNITSRITWYKEHYTQIFESWKDRHELFFINKLETTDYKDIDEDVELYKTDLNNILIDIEKEKTVIKENEGLSFLKGLNMTALEIETKIFIYKRLSLFLKNIHENKYRGVLDLDLQDMLDIYSLEVTAFLDFEFRTKEKEEAARLKREDIPFTYTGYEDESTTAALKDEFDEFKKSEETKAKLNSIPEKYLDLIVKQAEIDERTPSTTGGRKTRRRKQNKKTRKSNKKQKGTKRRKIKGSKKTKKIVKK